MAKVHVAILVYVVEVDTVLPDSHGNHLHACIVVDAVDVLVRLEGLDPQLGHF